MSKGRIFNISPTSFPGSYVILRRKANTNAQAPRNLQHRFKTRISPLSERRFEVLKREAGSHRYSRCRAARADGDAQRPENLSGIIARLFRNDVDIGGHALGTGQRFGRIKNADA